MKRFSLPIAFAVALGCTAPEEAFSAPSQGSSPKWIRVPSADDFANYYPEAASRLEIGGKAVLDCKLDATGVPKECEVTEETPQGRGFGNAALRLSRLFKAASGAHGKVAAGTAVTIPIIFRQP